GRALAIAQEAVGQSFDQLLPPQKRHFMYMPFMHSEALDDQDRAVALFETMKKENPVAYDYALRHREVIQRFGRFPHRNAVLGRASTPEEEAYLAEPGAGF